ncbi:hypothetical protein [Roseicella aerolata]|uniref:Uncharacterized protein n=1 Tax=Roseicella aerolata TaxID=2883479 RepID=A0A9X1IJ01_9PROT|nr:hypothetical protein [Roseicella aerolata]MCB4825529.1 hypothetical protein [Roseicella aerolata]
MSNINLSGITMGEKAKRHLRMPLDALTPSDIGAAVQDVGASFRDHEAAFHAGHSPDEFRDLERHRAAAHKAEACLAAGDLRGAILAVIAYWDEA